MLRASSIRQSFGDAAVPVNPPVAKKRPVAPHFLQLAQVDFANKNFFFIVRSLQDHAAKGIAEERSAPELQTLTRGDVAADIAVFVFDAIDHGDINSVGNGVGPLDGSPGVLLCLAVPRFLRRVPANGSGI